METYGGPYRAWTAICILVELVQRLSGSLYECMVGIPDYQPGSVSTIYKALYLLKSNLTTMVSGNTSHSVMLY